MPRRSVKMIPGFELSCEGIVGDGCGGGRTFYIEDETLLVFDPVTKTSQTLLENIKEAKSISKQGCEIFITTQAQKIVFNLSTFQVHSEVL